MNLCNDCEFKKMNLISCAGIRGNYAGQMFRYALMSLFPSIYLKNDRPEECCKNQAPHTNAAKIAEGTVKARGI